MLIFVLGAGVLVTLSGPRPGSPSGVAVAVGVGSLVAVGVAVGVTAGVGVGVTTGVGVGVALSSFQIAYTFVSYQTSFFFVTELFI